MSLDVQIQALTDAVMATQSKLSEEVKNLGTALTETKSANLQLRNELDALITKQAELPEKAPKANWPAA